MGNVSRNIYKENPWKCWTFKGFSKSLMLLVIISWTIAYRTRIPDLTPEFLCHSIPYSKIIFCIPILFSEQSQKIFHKYFAWCHNIPITFNTIFFYHISIYQTIVIMQSPHISWNFWIPFMLISLNDYPTLVRSDYTHPVICTPDTSGFYLLSSYLSSILPKPPNVTLLMP